MTFEQGFKIKSYHTDNLREEHARVNAKVSWLEHSWKSDQRGESESEWEGKVEKDEVRDINVCVYENMKAIIKTWVRWRVLSALRSKLLWVLCSKSNSGSCEGGLILGVF